MSDLIKNLEEIRLPTSAPEDLLAMPPQWTRHECTIMAWPFHESEEWMVPIEDARRQYLEFLTNLARVDKVLLLVRPEDVRDLPPVIKETQTITVLTLPLNDVWTRDYAPIFITNSTTRLPVVWEFTAWGGKFTADADQVAWRPILTNLGHEQFIRGPLALEGGAVEVDGKGYALSTRSCLLSPSRARGHSEEETIKTLKTYFGVHTVVLLGSGFVGSDHTDGHIDMTARFTPSGDIVANWCEDTAHPSAQAFADNEAVLRSLCETRGGAVRRVPIPRRVITGPNWGGGTVVAPANYMNFYATHCTVFVPQFNDTQDAVAIKIIQECFPEHEIMGLPADDLVRGGGGIFNCLTQQVPAVYS